MDLPKGHWMHGALAKEKARMAKKKDLGKGQAGKGTVAAPVAGGLNVASKAMPTGSDYRC